MSPDLKVFLGILFFLLGLGYLYRPDVMERIYAVLRKVLLNDAQMRLERRKWGMFFLLMSLLFLYMGWSAMNRAMP